MKPAFFLLLILIFITSCAVEPLPIEPMQKISGDFLGCGTGAFVNGMQNISAFQTKSGKKLAVVLWYISWPDPFPTAEANLADSNRSISHITWEPWILNPLGTLEAIASGSYESYVRSFMQAAKEWGKPLFLRFAHEMNGNWYPWDGFHNGQVDGPSKYKQAWIYIYNIREEVGANNVNLVWCPNHANQPNESWNTISNYYPGDQYVDWVGMDGYNWGEVSWQDFNSVFNNVYQTLINLTDKPLMIGEFASAEQGGSKAAWIADAFFKIKNNYPRVKIFNWFNIDKTSYGERDWRIESSASSEAAYKQAISDGYFIDSLL